MSLNPLAPVTDYQSMLNRIFWFTAAAALVATWLLRLYIPAIETLLTAIDLRLELNGEKIVPIPGGYLVPALAMGLLARVFRLHARISDELGIRESFDVDVIIRQLAERVDVNLDQFSYDHLAARRHSIMREAFYRYVSGPEPQIDPQLVQHALDAWSWFWIGVEATFVFTLTGFGLLAGGVYVVGLEVLACTVLFAAIALPALRSQCRRYAIAQVRAIVADATRSNAVRVVIAQCISEVDVRRRAA